MKQRLNVTIAILVAVTGGAASAQKSLPIPGESHRASAMEIAQLPQFCWAQYTDHRGPQYSIPGICGPNMNHYCYGLVEELRANQSFGNTKQRLGYLRAAKYQTEYTINGMKNYPGCPLRDHVFQTYERVNARIQAIGGR
jgi:hypothetical protein